MLDATLAHVAPKCHMMLRAPGATVLAFRNADAC